MLVFFPISETAGLIVAIVLYAACVLLLIAASPTIRITETELIAGKARVPLEIVGEATAYSRDEARQERGPRLDARAWLLIRGWVDPVVKVEITETADPTPYWLLSSRRPAEVVAALSSAAAKRAGV